MFPDSGAIGMDDLGFRLSHPPLPEDAAQHKANRILAEKMRERKERKKKRNIEHEERKRDQARRTKVGEIVEEVDDGDDNDDESDDHELTGRP